MEGIERHLGLGLDLCVSCRQYMRLSPRLRGVSILSLAMTVFILAGCGSGGTDTPEEESGVGNSELGEGSEGLSPEEFDRAYLECMEESGWVLSRDEFGQLSITLSESQEEDYERASEDCASKFQVAAKYSEPLDDEQWQVVHAYYEQTVIPCLESLGYTPDPLPSLDVFIATVDSPEAYVVVSPEVYTDIAEDVNAGRWESPDDVINGQCEVSPPEDQLYP